MKKTRPEITILTDPVPTGRRLLSERARQLARWARDSVSPPPAYVDRRYRGHFAVTRSAVEGLAKIGVATTYNPSRLEEVAPSVVVLGGVEALRQSIEWKRAGMVECIAAGPNVVNVPTAADRLLTSPEVDMVITPSEQVSELYRSLAPELDGRVVAWPAGVDSSYWTPQPARRNPKRLVWFEKAANWSGGSVAEYREVARARGWEIADVVYGHYRPDDYREALRTSSALAGFVDSESQGIAWAEAWSADVPTLLWYKPSHVFLNEPALRDRVVRTSPAPYLTAATGAFFSAPDAFDRLLSAYERGEQSFSPRAWVEQNMTDEVCATRLYDLARGIKPAIRRDAGVTV